MKMNSLVDKRCIRALYRASQAGVPVELNIRGICCLRPGRARACRRTSASSRSSAASSSTRASSRSSATASTTVYIGSADLMPRNLDTRVELRRAGATTPTLRAELLDTLERCFADDTNAWELGADGALDAPRRRRAPSRATCSAS